MKHIKDLANPAVDRVLIYAGDGGCYWRENGCGYTNAQNAGVFTRAEAIGWAGHCGPEKRVELHDVPDDHLPTIRARIAQLEAELAEARRDGERLDYLEREMEYERRCIDHGVAPAHSLFRRNVPITRSAIDDARGAT